MTKSSVRKKDLFWLMVPYTVQPITMGKAWRGHRNKNLVYFHPHIRRRERERETQEVRSVLNSQSRSSVTHHSSKAAFSSQTVPLSRSQVYGGWFSFKLPQIVNFFRPQHYLHFFLSLLQVAHFPASFLSV